MGSCPSSSNTTAKMPSAITNAPTKYRTSRKRRGHAAGRSSILSCHSFFLSACTSAIACSHLLFNTIHYVLPPCHQKPNVVQARLFVRTERAYNASAMHHHEPIAQGQQLVQVLGDQEYACSGSTQGPQQITCDVCGRYVLATRRVVAKQQLRLASCLA